MAEAIDETLFSLLLHPKARGPVDPSTGKPIANLHARIDELIETWQEDRETVILPTPVLSQFLVLAGKDGPQYLAKLRDYSFFQVAPFDERAAVELAAIQIGIRASGGKRGMQEGTWAKISFDRQIVAIAKINRVTAIYTDDDGLAKFAKSNGITPIRTWELPHPRWKQESLPYDTRPESTDSSAAEIQRSGSGLDKGEATAPPQSKKKKEDWKI
jgi:predicted nucleic acid-binding protein